MRKHILILALALSVFLLPACTNTNDINNGASVILNSGESENPNAGVAAQEEASTDVQSADIEAGVSTAHPQITQTDDALEASFEPSAEESNSNVQEAQQSDDGADAPAPSPEGTATPDIVAEQELAAESPQNDTGEQPPLMTKLVQEAGLSFDDVAFSQIVLVAAEGSKAMIYCYDQGDNGLWQFNGEIGYINGYVGRNGVSFSKSEGDDCTPAGLFKLGYSFGNSKKPVTGMEYKAITEESYWVDDPNSQYYNQWVEGADNADWSSAEDLSVNISSYAYAVVVEYNMAPNTVSGKGSAIFIHCGNEATSGCIVVPEETLLKMLEWLSADKNPGILIAAQ